MESYYTPHNKTNRTYLYSSKESKILASKKNITVVNLHQLDMDITVKQFLVLVL